MCRCVQFAQFNAFLLDNRRDGILTNPYGLCVCGVRRRDQTTYSQLPCFGRAMNIWMISKLKIYMFLFSQYSKFGFAQNAAMRRNVIERKKKYDVVRVRGVNLHQVS